MSRRSRRTNGKRPPPWVERKDLGAQDARNPTTVTPWTRFACRQVCGDRAIPKTHEPHSGMTTVNVKHPDGHIEEVQVSPAFEKAMKLDNIAQRSRDLTMLKWLYKDRDKINKTIDKIENRLLRSANK
jgi:hypothetical protein